MPWWSRSIWALFYLTTYVLIASVARLGVTDSTLFALALAIPYPVAWIIEYWLGNHNRWRW